MTARDAPGCGRRTGTPVADSATQDTSSSEPAAPRTRWRAIGGVALAVLTVAFVASVVRSTLTSSTPVVTSSAMPGMAMDSQQLALSLRDVDGRPVRIPGGRPGVIVFAEARRCGSCVSAARTARDAARAIAPRAQVVVVMLNSNTSRASVNAFARSVGPGPARYVIDKPSRRVAAMFDVATLGGTVVYDARGRVVADLQPGSREIAASLRRGAR